MSLKFVKLPLAPMIRSNNFLHDFSSLSELNSEVSGHSFMHGSFKVRTQHSVVDLLVFFGLLS